jgi:hypothetical protein
MKRKGEELSGEERNIEVVNHSALPNREARKDN